jgi:uncharacterized protein (TIGR00661 family)
MSKNRTILVAPLHWGLGHAARCIPIISGLIENDFNVIIASDGEALLLLKKEFPKLNSIELPSYNIRYSKNGKWLKWSLMKRLPNYMRVISKEREIVDKLVTELKIDGIISDNRFGVNSSRVPSVYITHQLNVLSGNTTILSSKKHRRVIKKFDECWVPDFEKEANLSGKLGHLNDDRLNIKYIGLLSRMEKIEYEKKYDILFLLSGPEPQREYLEKIIINDFANRPLKTLLVKGVIEKDNYYYKNGNIKIVNYLLSDKLEKMINKSELVVSRPGYTTIMDLAALGKKAFFIPTPGQYEQEYLAKRLTANGIIPSCKQKSFCYDRLNEVSSYKGFQEVESNNNFKDLFTLFEGK